MSQRIGSLAELRSAYREGALTPTDQAERVLAGLAGRDGAPVWISTVPADRLRARAASLTRDGDPAMLPLYGVPFAVKDNIDVAGMVTTAGCPDFGYEANADAPVVRRLLDAGALLVGKTNLDQFATGLTGTRSPYGSCESVFGGGLISGGSSSGSAVAVATGQVTFALGTDTAGSGRVPAALNGIVGVKPTRGLLSTAGVVPACRSLDCVSVFAADVAGAMDVLHAARGVTAADPWGRPLPAERVPARMPGTLRLGAPRAEDLEFFGDAGQRDRFTAGVGRLRDLVAYAQPVPLGTFFEAGDLLYQGPWVAERLTGLDGFLRERPEAVLAVTRTVLETGRRYDAIDAFRGRHRLRELRARVDQVWQEVDVLVVPTVGTTFTLDEIAEDPIGRNAMLGRYTQFANLLDLAAVTVPNGFTAAGRPASLTLVGPAFSDTTLARLAAAFAAGTGAEPADAGRPAAGAGPAPGPAEVLVAVVGRHLTGESRNGELTDRGATLAGTTRTAPCYRLYRMDTPDGEGLPGLVRVDPARGHRIDVELWRLPTSAVGGLLAGVPAPLSLGWVRLDDGRAVLGFLCEAYAAGPEAEDISAAGGWRAYRSAGRR
ncbi:allophanate hydrolase [Micromonospora sp. ATCC 39149]|uniref:Allophanate hydrolase n=1 Tax=Micromonospora carbonacea TaxID=47853 RepID=A0A7D5YCD0_9ACTN|nr:allophanate hydrolase [Micromonospora sp. ATCC 39149]EEP71924.1 allophanate hydrolase [Micromonospora sp. ATCC 39149]QLJ98137.1 allophanate hydrolase [Micromonospora carbonacea]